MKTCDASPPGINVLNNTGAEEAGASFFPEGQEDLGQEGPPRRIKGG